MEIQNKEQAIQFSLKLLKNKNYDSCVMTQKGDIYINANVEALIKSFKKIKLKYFIIK